VISGRAVAVLVTAVFSLTVQAGDRRAAPPFSERTAAAIDTAAAAHLATGKSAGLAVAVIQRGKVVFSRGYGKANLEWNTPMTADSVFRIASNTKTFTAVSVLLLVQEGGLSLDDKLSRFYPAFPRAGEVTIRQLLTHTSGITSYDEIYRGKPELAVARSMTEMTDFIARLEPLYRFEPGTAYRYSNSGYYLLGGIVEKVSGVSLEQFMTERIFRKIGLRHTAMDEIEDIVPRRAAGYLRDPEKPGVFSNAPFIPHTTPGPAGGLRSTVDDLARWHAALFGGELLAPELLQQMTAPGRLADGRRSSEVVSGSTAAPVPAPYEYGFGIRISNFQGRREFWHSGAIEGFTSQIRTYPDDQVTIALLANTFRALDGFLEAVLAAVLLPSGPSTPTSTERSQP
jgi:D-alanyl-D-alanine carboxypeptidase